MLAWPTQQHIDGEHDTTCQPGITMVKGELRDVVDNGMHGGEVHLGAVMGRFGRTRCRPATQPGGGEQ